MRAPPRTRLLRGGYRVAYGLLVVWSRVVRPHTRGVKCLVARGDELLLVRHCYGPGRWDLPGGFCRRGEPFAAAARRELGEELGVREAAWTDLGELARRNHGRHETLHLFRVELEGAEPAARSAEIVEVGWFARGALPPGRARVVDEILGLEVR